MQESILPPASPVTNWFNHYSYCLGGWKLELISGKSFPVPAILFNIFQSFNACSRNESWGLCFASFLMEAKQKTQKFTEMSSGTGIRKGGISEQSLLRRVRFLFCLVRIYVVEGRILGVTKSFCPRFPKRGKAQDDCVEAFVQRLCL